MRRKDRGFNRSYFHIVENKARNIIRTYKKNTATDKWVPNKNGMILSPKVLAANNETRYRLRAIIIFKSIVLEDIGEREVN